MDEVIPRFTGAIIVSLVLAFVITLLPFKAEWDLYRPEWLALTFIHWGLVSPNKSSLLLAWFVGLMVDALYGSIIGQHALGFTIVLFLTLRMRSRLLLDSVIQQIFLLCFVLGTYLLINLWILGITGNSPKGWDYWFTVASSIIVWPFYNFFLKIFHSNTKMFDS